MKNGLTILVLAALVLSGCSAASLQDAEKNTRLTGMVPGGGIIYLPIWAASTIVGEPEVVLTEEDEANMAKKLNEARSRLSECFYWPGHDVGRFKLDYVCPADAEWEEANAQIQSSHDEQADTSLVAEVKPAN